MKQLEFLSKRWQWGWGGGGDSCPSKTQNTTLLKVDVLHSLSCCPQLSLHSWPCSLFIIMGRQIKAKWEWVFVVCACVGRGRGGGTKDRPCDLVNGRHAPPPSFSLCLSQLTITMLPYLSREQKIAWKAKACVRQVTDSWTIVTLRLYVECLGSPIMKDLYSKAMAHLCLGVYIHAVMFFTIINMFYWVQILDSYMCWKVFTIEFFHVYIRWQWELAMTGDGQRFTFYIKG